MGKKLSREQEMAELSELLKIRIYVFRQDVRFEPHEGTEVRMCLLAHAIFVEQQKTKDEDWLQTAQNVIRNQKLVEPICLSADNVMLAIDLAKAMEADAQNDIDMDAPEKEHLEMAETLNVRCSASNELGIAGFMARPRSEYIRRFIKETNVYAEHAPKEMVEDEQP